MTEPDLKRLEAYMDWAGQSREYQKYHPAPMSRAEAHKLILDLIDCYKRLTV